jgi:integrase
MPKFETNQIDLNGDGRIILYQRPDVKNPKWQCRISVAGSTGYKIFSTKESDLGKAERIALTKYEELYFKVRRGGFLKGKPFNVVVKEWIDTFGDNLKAADRQTIRRVEQLALPFHKTKSIDDISEGDLFEMMESLKNGAPLQTSTIRHYRTSVNKVFDYAKTKGYIENKPTIPAPTLVRNPRPDFTEADWKILVRHMRTWVVENTTGDRGKNGLDRKRHRERFYLQHYILIMGNTGIRIGEMRNVRWVDLTSGTGEDGEERVLISVDGKTGRRTVVSNLGVETYIKRLWDFRSGEVGTEPEMDELIFCHPSGQRIGSYITGYNKLLGECGLRKDNEGRYRTLYSLRHTYATMRINRVPVYQLAVNMGTSIEMIEQFYSHARTADPAFVSAMTKGNQRGTGRALPF